MNADEIITWGEGVDPSELTRPLLLAIAGAIEKHPFASFVEARRDGEIEGVVFDFNVELPQEPPVPIASSERILIRIGPDDNTPPIVSPLRYDFPDTLHLNLTPKGEPKQLCIFEEDFREVKARLTPRILLDRIADWLARAAVEKLHLSDQALEPFLLTSDRIIFSRDAIFSSGESQPLFCVERISENPNILRATKLPDDIDPRKLRSDIPFHLVLPLAAAPWHSRLINHQPTNFADLADLLSHVEVDIKSEASDLIRRVHDDDKLALFQRHHLIPIIHLPKTRTRGGPVESSEWWSFIVDCTIEELAVRLGVMAKHDGRLVPFVGGSQAESDLDQIPVVALRPTFALTKRFARLLSGGNSNSPKLLAVGAGSLGSQVTLNLARQGFGEWTILDDDQLLPHNLPRHALPFHHEGQNKADSLAFDICGLFNDPNAAKSFPVDVLIGNVEDDYQSSVRDADAILDFSASHAVARFLADDDGLSPRLCAFVGPEARFLIVMFEGQERNVRLDDLEIQLKAAIAENAHLHGVFSGSTRSISYAGSCRDSSVQLPQEVLAIQAGVAAHFIKQNIFSVTPSIGLWEWSPTQQTLQRHHIPVHTVTILEESGWTIRLSSHATDRIRYFRRQRLPNETGGVLLGSFDHERRIVYIASILPSPSDSSEWPNAYIRGVKGLREHLEEISNITRGDLVYVGEWHTHPVGSTNQPSDDDKAAHGWLIEEMSKVGSPGVVLIQGDDRNPHIMLSLQE